MVAYRQDASQRRRSSGRTGTGPSTPGSQTSRATSGRGGGRTRARRGSGRTLAATVRGRACRRMDPRLPLILLGTVPGELDAVRPSTRAPTTTSSSRSATSSCVRACVRCSRASICTRAAHRHRGWRAAHRHRRAPCHAAPRGGDRQQEGVCAPAHRSRHSRRGSSPSTHCCAYSGATGRPPRRARWTRMPAGCDASSAGTGTATSSTCGARDTAW